MNHCHLRNLIILTMAYPYLWNIVTIYFFYLVADRFIIYQTTGQLSIPGFYTNLRIVFTEDTQYGNNLQAMHNSVIGPEACLLTPTETRWFSILAGLPWCAWDTSYINQAGPGCLKPKPLSDVFGQTWTTDWLCYCVIHFSFYCFVYATTDYCSTIIVCRFSRVVVVCFIVICVVCSPPIYDEKTEIELTSSEIERISSERKLVLLFAQLVRLLVAFCAIHELTQAATCAKIHQSIAYHYTEHENVDFFVFVYLWVMRPMPVDYDPLRPPLIMLSKIRVPVKLPVVNMCVFRIGVQTDDKSSYTMCDTFRCALIIMFLVLLSNHGINSAPRDLLDSLRTLWNALRDLNSA